jgi:type II secretory ATPase GspE/PulE/Tfp pilus assembly ATPase PilB-like protein/GAF domain-containing protein
MNPRHGEIPDSQPGRRYLDKLKPLINKILHSDSLESILPALTRDLQELFECEAVTLFNLDRGNRRLYSRNFQGSGVNEIRVDISTKSLAGFVAATGKSLNIVDVSNKEELTRHHPTLEFDARWDEKTNFQTRSVLVIPLHHNKKLMGVLEALNKNNGGTFTDQDMRIAIDLAATLGNTIAKMEMDVIEEKFRTTSLLIHSVQSIENIFIELKTPIMQLFDATTASIYAIDEGRNEIFSLTETDAGIAEIRLPISTKTIAGYVALTKKPVNIVNAYDAAELHAHHPEMVFDDEGDSQTHCKIKSILTYPLAHEDHLMGILHLVNKRGDESFNAYDEKNAQAIAQALALAFHNHKKVTQQKSGKYGWLVDNGLISAVEITQAITKSRHTKIELETILIKDFGLKRSDIGKSLEKFFNVPYNGYSDSVLLGHDVLTGLNKNFLLKHFWLPLQIDEHSVTVLTNDPADHDQIQNIKLLYPKKKIELRVGLKADIVDFVDSALVGDAVGGESAPDGVAQILTTLQTENSGDAPAEEDEVSAISETDSTIVRLVNKILTDAYDQGVSDIHIEPGTAKKNTRIRFRKDGSCFVYEEIPYLYKQAIISRIKIMARLDIAERRLPQDGKIKMKYGKKDVEFRVATCPTVGGNEDAVLRILAASEPLPLEKMNFSPRNLQLIQDMVQKPYGLILVVGPTGSGKTTTLHSCLGHINTPDIKIWTAEDPVEITQDGLRQVQMHSKIGFDFARAMRSFLRGDPDVIMVGEMRDAETCAIGLEASLTGHMVFSTLHTNSAPETITRLLDMGMNPLNFADALLLILAQRLVRTLCKHCKQDHHPSAEEFDLLPHEYGEKHFQKLGLQYDAGLLIKKAAGCKLCLQTGYAGRTGMHEILEGTATIKRMIMKQASVEELREQAILDGMTTLKQDGIRKILKGDTDLREVNAVCIV